MSLPSLATTYARNYRQEVKSYSPTFIALWITRDKRVLI